MKPKVSLMMALVMSAMAVLGSTSVHARPNPDQLGICYFFAGDTLKQKTPCIVATGYGAGAMYTSLSVDGREYSFETNTMTEDGEITYNDSPVDGYFRDAGFYFELSAYDLESRNDSSSDSSNDTIPCYRTQDGKLDICYLIQ